MKKFVCLPTNSWLMKLESLPKKIPTGAQILNKSEISIRDSDFILLNTIDVIITPRRAP